MDLDKEFEKLRDLEFDYNLALLSRQDEDIVKLAKGKYLRQINKVRKMQEASTKEQKD